MADLSDWHQIARNSNYRDEEEMLSDLYITKRLSIRDIAKVVGYSYKAVWNRLSRYKLDVRARGGPNHISKG